MATYKQAKADYEKAAEGQWRRTIKSRRMQVTHGRCAQRDAQDNKKMAHANKELKETKQRLTISFRIKKIDWQCKAPAHKRLALLSQCFFRPKGRDGAHGGHDHEREPHSKARVPVFVPSRLLRWKTGDQKSEPKPERADHLPAKFPCSKKGALEANPKITASTVAVTKLAMRFLIMAGPYRKTLISRGMNVLANFIQNLS